MIYSVRNMRVHSYESAESYALSQVFGSTSGLEDI